MPNIRILFDDSPVIEAGQIHEEHGHAMQRKDSGLFTIRLNREALSRGEVRKEITTAEEGAVDRLMAELDEFKQFATWKAVFYRLKERTGQSFFDILSPYLPEVQKLRPMMQMGRDPFSGNMTSIFDRVLMERNGPNGETGLDLAVLRLNPSHKTRSYQMMAGLVDKDFQYRAARPGQKAASLIPDILKDDDELNASMRQLYIDHLKSMLDKGMNFIASKDIEALVDSFLSPDTLRHEKQAAVHQFLHNTVGISEDLVERVEKEIPPLSGSELNRRDRVKEKLEGLIERLGREFPEYLELLGAIGVDINICRDIAHTDTEVTQGRSVLGRKQIDMLQEQIVNETEESAYHVLLEEVTHYLDNYIGFSRNPVFEFPQAVVEDMHHPPAVVALHIERFQDGLADIIEDAGMQETSVRIKPFPWSDRYRHHINQEWLVDIQAVEQMLRKAQDIEDLPAKIIAGSVPHIGKITPALINLTYGMMNEYEYPLSDADRKNLMDQLFPETYQGLVNFRVEVEREIKKLDKRQHIDNEGAVLRRALAEGEEGVVKLLSEGISSTGMGKLQELVVEDMPSLKARVEATQALHNAVNGSAAADPISLGVYIETAILDARIDGKTVGELASEKMKAAVARENYDEAARMRDLMKAIEKKQKGRDGITA